MNNYKSLTKEKILSDNGDLLHFVSLYLLIYTILYIYLVGKSCDVPLSSVTSTKISQTMVLTFPPFYHIQQQQNKSTTYVHLVRPLGFLPSKYFIAYHGRPVDITVLCLMQATVPSKITKPNGFKDLSINILCKWSK